MVQAVLDRFRRPPSILRVICEGILLIVVVGFAAWRFWLPPALAADLPEESAKYVVPALNLYQTGRYDVVINHRAHPADGGLGYGLLILPSYWLAGPAIGNAIYSQLVLDILVCLALYVSVRLCFGVWPALLAALTPPLYYTFFEYARMLDTSIASALFLSAGLLVFLRVPRPSRMEPLKWALWGLGAGWATAVRSSNALVFLVLTIVLWSLYRPGARQCMRNFTAAALGAAPLVAPVLWYNHHYCGAWLRDAHAYWQSNPFDNFSRVFGLRCALGIPDYDLAMNDRGNLLAYTREMACQFVLWPFFRKSMTPWDQASIFALTGVMLGGVIFAFRRAKVDQGSRLFLWYSLTTIGVTLAFYSFCEFRANRYIVPLAPFCAAFLGLGIVDIVRGLWLRKHTATLISTFLVLVAWPYYRLVRLRPVERGNTFPVADILRAVQSRVESNAVVIANIYPPLLELSLVRNTQRQAVLFKGKIIYRVQPRPPRDPSKIPKYITNGYPGDLENGAMDIFEFSALEDPGRIQQFLDKNIPVYAIDQTMGLFTRDDLTTLNRYFQLVPFATMTPSARVRAAWPVVSAVVVWQLKSRTPTISLQ